MLNQLFLVIVKVLSRIASLKDRRNLEKSLRAPEIAQLKLLGHLQHLLKPTEQVQRLQWTESGNYAEFISKIPCVHYEDIAPQILSQMRLGQKILSPTTPQFYERTSGSSGSAKYIPYTKAYLKILNSLFLLWADDILNSSLRLRSARTFLCVTPPLPRIATDNPVQIGSDTDADYVARWLSPLLNRFLAVPLALHCVRDPVIYKDLLCLHLFAAADLEIVSLWSPSFWLAMLDHFHSHRQRLLASAAQGFYRTPDRRWNFAKISAARVKILEAPAPDWQALWPDLVFISCWNQGHAAAGAKRLAAMFPRALIQGKGLLATEAPVSLPLLKAGTAVPFLTEVFIEGEDLLDQRIYPLWEMRLGHSYKIIVSLPNGILRYRLGDIIRITGFYAQTPVFEFLGRDGAIMDLVGEKLTEAFLCAVLTRLPAVSSGTWSLFPVQNEQHSYYHLFTDQPQTQDHSQELDEQLCTAHHYALARNLGQLASVKIEYQPRWSYRCLELAAARGQQRGNIKVALLHKRIYSDSEINDLRSEQS